ncbi:ATP-dependent DNA helicase PIF1 [Bactrocera neohumeralis]|uniref:ATP-dependent DNA helicase PIF1 n=1 Tax=Bactrocera neohumeralis TaxID=98809 RepID=UPI002166670D|nr:ATP-dependent DNA helicase PIF1 [Bactrocera neohumeralis]
MDLNDAVLTCAVNILWTNAVGVTGKKMVFKIATLRLIRNDVRELFIEVAGEKAKPIKFKLKDVMVHKKFMSEGKATINFKIENCSMYLSNAPPGTLMYFLRTIFIKLNGAVHKDEATTQKQLRAHMLSGKPSNFEEVSPITTTEMIMARKKAGLLGRSSATTPSPLATKKRRFDDIKMGDGKVTSNAPAAKRLYQDKSTPSLGMEDNVKLCEEQLEVLRACTSGKNVFFTGSAGTGKSFLLRKIISALPPDGTMATASTGVAACLIGGTTLHAFAGIGGGDYGLTRCIELASRAASAQIWRKCKRLIIDEISMVDGQYFEKIEAVARHVRKNDKPFGGIQLILCGDFLQLPPVVKNENNSNPTQRFCFQSNAWEKCIQCVFELKEVHRQSDPEFVNILNHIRIGHVNEEITKRLRATSKQKIEGGGILATQLCSHTNDAQSINETKLESLEGENILFRSEDSDANMVKQLDSQLQATSQLYLKINAQVMLLKNINISAGLVNGARGVVVRFEKGLPVVRFKNNREYVCSHEKWIIKSASGGTITRRQVPLKLAWAFSIHKSQGLTLDCVEMSLSKVFEAGQAYVALSRAKSLDSLRILDFDPKQVWANAQVLQYYKLFRRRLHDSTMIPLGAKNIKREKNNDPKSSALSKLKKSLMDKPLVSIS